MDEQAAIKKAQADVRAFAGDSIERAVVCSGGGLGDLLKAAAFCAALKNNELARFGYTASDSRPPKSVALVFNETGCDADGTSLSLAALRDNPAVDKLIEHNGIQQARMVRAIYDIPLRFFEVQTATVRSWYWGAAGAQLLADQCAAPYRNFSDHLPLSNRSLMEASESQWQMLSKSSGIPVSPSDMFIAPGDLPGCFDNDRYVVVNNGCGGDMTMKCIPQDVIGDLCGVLVDEGINVVQVGLKVEPVVPNALDMRGLSLRDSAELIRHAKMYIGPEGGMAYVALAVDTPGIVFYGPTPVNVFHAEGQSWISRQKCRPCWWQKPDWGTVCPKGCAVCKNMPEGGKALGRQLARQIIHESEVE